MSSAQYVFSFAVALGMATLAARADPEPEIRPPEGQAAVLTHRAMWVWDQGAIAEDGRARAALFDFARTRAVDTLYFESPDLVLNDPEVLARFLDAARARGLSVELLFASVAVRPDDRDASAAVVERTVRFASALRGAKPTALHFDIEPHLVDGWKTGGRPGLVRDYLALLEAIVAVKGPFPVHVDIPFWFDKIAVPSDAGRPERTLDAAVLAIVDGCTLMDYRDRATGPTGLVAEGRGVLRDADRADKPVLVGVETNDVMPQTISFYRRGAHAMDSQLVDVELAYEGDAAFAGTAIEDYDGYRNLRP